MGEEKNNDEKGKKKDERMSANETSDTESGGENLTPISSETLLKGHNEVMIRHEDQIYRLRRTAKGKLIMTK